MLTEPERKGVEVLAVSSDPKEKLKEMADRIQAKSSGAVWFKLLSDPDHEVIDRYGLRNEAAAAKGRFIPHPTTYVIGKDGNVAWHFTEVDHKIRPSNEDIRAALRRVRD